MNEDKNQTGVEFLFEQVANLDWRHLQGEEKLKIFEQAKEIEAKQHKITEDTSDGYHTFKELYEFRMTYNALLFREWYHQSQYGVHKSKRHHDGELCFGGGWFIVVAMLPTGMISNHYELQHWDLFDVPTLEKAAFPFDGHTSKDVLQRMIHLLKPDSGE